MQARTHMEGNKNASLVAHELYPYMCSGIIDAGAKYLFIDMSHLSLYIHSLLLKKKYSVIVMHTRSNIIEYCQYQL